MNPWIEPHVIQSFFARHVPAAVIDLEFVEVVYYCPWLTHRIDETRVVAELWPREEYADRSKFLRSGDGREVYWSSRSGTLHTAALLYKFRDDKVVLPYIWLAAFLHDLRHLKLELKIDRAKVSLHQLEDQVWTCLRANNIYHWHHAARDALPGGDHVLYAIHRFEAQITEKHSFLELAVMAVSASLAQYRPVAVRSSTSGSPVLRPVHRDDT